MFVRLKPSPSLPPPIVDKGLIGWMHTNLFSSVTNTLLTLMGAYILYLIVPPFVDWAIINANFSGNSREDCTDTLGACWVFIKVRFGLLMYGFYPEAERWRIDFVSLLLLGSGCPLLLAPFLPFSKRINDIILKLIPLGCGLFIFINIGLNAGFVATIFLGLPFILTYSKKGFGKFVDNIFCGNILLSLGLGLILGFAASSQGAAWPIGIGGFFLGLLIASLRQEAPTVWQFWTLYLILPCIAWILLLGGYFSLPSVQTDQWGGFFLTMVIALVGVATSLPIGIILALGRNSTMPVVRVLCISFIEFARGVPLISVLFMVSVMLPMMLPEGSYFNKLLRALIGVSLFYAAYMAEVVRGGLQAIPKGQYEAAQSLGLRYWTHMRLIILPQALRLVIPGITNTYLGLMKDTTLVAVINLMDILGIIKSALADTRWLGFTKEAYFFAGLIFWIMCFIVSRYSLYLERRLNWKKK